jgi:predicted ATPase/predicted Ser/Thr protein kinase
MSDRQSRADRLFREALTREERDRDHYLEQVCSSDPETRDEVQSLIASHQEGHGSPGSDYEHDTKILPPDQHDSRIDQRISTGSLIERYKILAPLGRGGMGEVYLAEDTLLQRKVAIKLLPSEFVKDQDRLRRFTQEARAASALNHPNITTIHDVVEDVDAGRFLVMEFIKGRTLRELIRESDALESIATIGGQIARALAAAHSAGIIHRDIKPENIMLREDGYVKVLDFGLARLVAQFDQSSAMSAPGVILGTVAYMSPEQTRGEVVSSASDIFSLGIVLYELATRQHPFTAASQGGYLEAIATTKPILPSRLNREISAALETLILSMLGKDHRLRPSAAEVDTALSQQAGTASRGPAAESVPTRAIGKRKRSTVGREREHARLKQAFERVAVGKSLIMAVSGEPGMGKTTLVEQFITDLIEAGQPCNVGLGRSSERLAGTEAYMPVLEALESLLRGETRSVVARAMRVFAPTWYAQAAPLSTGEPSTVLSDEPRAASQERMKRELSALIEELSRTRPLILFFDDLHWADVSTVELLAYLSTRFDAFRLLVIVTYRLSEMLVAKHPFLQVKLDLQGRGLCHEVKLEFLSCEELESYLAKEFPDHRLPAEFSRLIYGKTEGSPLFMVDLVNYLRDRKVIDQQDGHWALVESIPEIERDLPESVRSLIQRKVDSLSEQHRLLLVGASVQGYEFDSAVLSEALGLDPADVEEQLDILDRTHAFVRQIEERELPDRTPTLRYRFVHALYQNAFYGLLRPTRRASLSQRVAETLLGHYGEEHAANIASELAFLFETARDYKRASDYFVRAAQQAIEVFANQEGVTLAQRAIDLIQTLPDGPERKQRELMAQMALGVALTPMKGFAAPEVERTYSRARELCQQIGEASHMFRVLYGLWSVYQLRADFKTADELTHQLLRMSEHAQDQSLLLRAHYARGFTLDYLGDHRAARQHYEEVLARYDMQDERANTRAYGNDAGLITKSRLAWILFTLGYVDQARRMLNDCISDARKMIHPFSSACALLSTPQVSQDFKEPEKVRELVEETVAICTEQGFPMLLAYINLHHGWALGQEGKLEEGIAEIRNNFAMLGAMGGEMSWTGFYVPLAELLAESGRFEESLKAADEGLARAYRTGERFFEAELYRVRGDVLSRQIVQETDRQRLSEAPRPPVNARWLIDQAEASYDKALAIARQRGARSHELRAAIGLGRLLEKQGDRQRGHQILARVCESFTQGFESPDFKSARELLNQLS